MRSRGLGRAVGAVMIVVAAAWPAIGTARGVEPAQQLGQALWTATEIEADGAGDRLAIEAEAMRTFTLDEQALSAALATAPASTGSLAHGAVVSLPAPGGGYERFRLTETKVMAPKLARLHPEILTYAGEGIDDPTATVRLTDSPLGLQASVRSGRQGAWFIDPLYRRDTSVYASYFAEDLTNRHGPLIEDELMGEARAAATGSSGERLSSGLAASHLPPRSRHRPGLRGLLRSLERERREGRARQPPRSDLRGRAHDQPRADRRATTSSTSTPPRDDRCRTVPAARPPASRRSQASGCSGGTLTRNRIVIGQFDRRQSTTTSATSASGARRRGRPARRVGALGQGSAAAPVSTDARRRLLRRRLRRPRDGPSVRRQPHLQRHPGQLLGRQPQPRHLGRAGQRLVDHGLRGHLRRRRPAASQRSRTSASAASRRS